MDLDSKLEKEFAALSKKLNNEDFLNKAPANVVDKVKEKYKTLSGKQGKLKTHLEKIKAFEA